MTDRPQPAPSGVVPARPDLGGGASTPSYALPAGATPGLPGAPTPLRLGSRTLAWGERTWVMGILNVTPDSFSGDGLLAAADPVAAAVARARAMVEDGADLLDVGGASSRPGHEPVDAEAEIGRVVPVVRALAADLPDVPVSVDTTRPSVAEAALDAGAVLLNDIWGVGEDPTMVRVAAERGVPIVLMHNRSGARYRNLLAEVVADLQRALDRALDAGVPWDHLVVDPGFGFGKTPDHNLALLAGLGSLRVLGRPILIGTSRKSTLGKVLDLPPDQRVEATAATTALGSPPVSTSSGSTTCARAPATARVADAILRGWRPDGWPGGA